ncbi:hypothetical protein AaE_013611 [Aphanomyces astaci]|uniref:Integrase catalytic domain-containing protein n=1 Tax=Aphanomyces astaci TaxID=112090 RepID=A0A6A4ZIR1_APHAT|nr:hypothetical protein AaE_013611 [Aphanomyces astaci]
MSMTPLLFQPTALLASWLTPSSLQLALHASGTAVSATQTFVDAFNQMTKTNPKLLFKAKHLRGQLRETCAYAKSKRSPFDSSAGPSPILSAGGAAYFIVFIDDYTRFMWTYPMRFRKDLYETYELYRTDAMSIFKLDVCELRHSSPMDIGTLQSDNAKEYEKLGRIIKPKYNTRVAFSNAYSPQQNAVAERRALPKFLWALVLHYASWLINISPSASNKGGSPYHVVFKRHPSLGHIKTKPLVAPRLCIFNVPRNRPTSIPVPSRPFCGSPTSHDRKGYTLMHLHSHLLIYSRDVTIWESEFPAINSVAAAAAYHEKSTTDPNFIPTLEPNAPLPPLHSIITNRPSAFLYDKPLDSSPPVLSTEPPSSRPIPNEFAMSFRHFHGPVRSLTQLLYPYDDPMVETSLPSRPIHQ